MKTKTFVGVFTVVVLLSTLNPQLSASPMGTAFTYQGKLTSGTNAANGVYDFIFVAFNAATLGVNQGATVVTNGVPVDNGYFAVNLDFGDVFPGEARWLEISVKTNGAANYTLLSPRQQLTPAPYAIMANSASNVLGTVPAAQLIGMVSLAQLPSAVITNNETGVALGSLTLNGNLILPTTTASAGSIYAGNNLLLHEYGIDNFFAGPGAGNLILTGDKNTGLGAHALQNNTSGFWNTATGSGALQSNTDGNCNTAVGTGALTANTSGYFNTAVGLNTLFSNVFGFENTAVGTGALQCNTNGYSNTANGVAALYSNTSGHNNVANGDSALYSNTDGSHNTANGAWSLYSNTSGWDNTAIGHTTLYSNTTGLNNTANGSYALFSNTNGLNNTASGFYSLYSNSSGSFNLALGYQAGINLTTGNNNIDIGNVGVAGESRRIRIGTTGTHTNTFIAGIYSNTVPTGLPVYVDATGQLGTGSGSPVALLNSNQTFTGAVTFNNPASSFTGNGSGLTSLNADNLSSGSVPDALLSGNVALRTGGNGFVGQQTMTGGNVGIGTTSPTEKLQVDYGNLLVRGTNNFASGTGAALLLGDGNNYVRAVSGQGLRLGVFQGADVLVLNNGGNVGIGTANPSEKLELAGRAKMIAASGTTLTVNNANSWGAEVAAAVTAIHASTAAEWLNSTIQAEYDYTGGIYIGGPSAFSGYARTKPGHDGFGVVGSTDPDSHTNGAGVVGYTFANDNNGKLGTYYDGIHGEQHGGTTAGAGVYGFSDLASGNGVVGEANSGGSPYGVWGKTTNPGGYAGYFSGRVYVAGTLSASDKQFKIDHPLDPANKCLVHSCVESAERINLYNGNVVLDENGEAWVTLPNWFEALNQDFRYQLTPIGAAAPNLHVAEEIKANRFRIAGGGAGLKVSWQIAGVRHDPWAEAHPMAVETAKTGAERGQLLNPEAYGQTEEKSIERANKGAPVSRPDLMKTARGWRKGDGNPPPGLRVSGDSSRQSEVNP